MKTLTLAAAMATTSLIPMAAQAAPVSILSMAVSGTVSGIDFGSALIESAAPDYTLTNFTHDPDLPLSYYGLSSGLFTTDIGGAVSGTITLFEDSETSELSLSCALAQYSYDTCAGGAFVGASTDADGNLALFSGDGGYETRIVRNGDTASMIYQDDNQYGGQTPDGLSWFNYGGLTITWDLTVETPTDSTPLVTTPLPSSALLLLTPLALIAWRRRQLRRV